MVFVSVKKCLLIFIKAVVVGCGKGVGLTKEFKWMRFMKMGLHDQFRDVMCFVEPKPSNCFQINYNNPILYRLEAL